MPRKGVPLASLFFDELKIECGEIEASTNVDKAEKQLAVLRKQKAAKLRSRGASSYNL
jgi:hypothetical protein